MLHENKSVFAHAFSLYTNDGTSCFKEKKLYKKNKN